MNNCTDERLLTIALESSNAQSTTSPSYQARISIARRMPPHNGDETELSAKSEQLIRNNLRSIASLAREHFTATAPHTTVVLVDALIRITPSPLSPPVILKRSITQLPSPHAHNDDDLDDPRRWGRL